MPSGNVVIVTGGTYGVGRGITVNLARRGYQVVAFGLDTRQIGSTAENGSEGTQAALVAEGLTADILEADVSSAKDVQRVVDFTLEKYGRIDGLVNNAAIHPSGTLLTTDEDVWDKVLDVNLKGMFLCAKAVLPAMIAQGGGSIVNIGSGSGWGRSNLLAYSASKGGVFALSAAMAYDHIHDHIRVNTVVPGGGLVTGMTEFLPNAGSGGANTVTGRSTTPEDMANAVAFFLSDDAIQISGAVLPVGCFDGQGGPVRPRPQPAPSA